MSAFTLGLDFGTNSVRALLVRCNDGHEVAVSVFDYPGGHQGILLDQRDANLARQHPGDYLTGLKFVVRNVLEKANVNLDGFDSANVIGIGVAATGSSPLPVDANNCAIGMSEPFTENLDAQCWLWKDHTSHREAERITALASRMRPQYLAKCGGTYSSEWWWSKIWHCCNAAPDVFAAAYSWVELADWIPSILAGVIRPQEIKRGICGAGHKAMYANDWGGLPDKKFLQLLDPKIGDLRDRLYELAYDAASTAGNLCDLWATELGLPADIPIAIGKFDVHYGAIGAGVEDGVLVKVIGTSTCDCIVVDATEVADIPGVCGIVNGSILPHHFGIEAGQSAVGDIFKWWVETICHGNEKTHLELTNQIHQQAVGAHGLLALDWNNGNRTVLVDQRLTGVILGQTLHTTPAEIYRALIEATAFGARMILERIAQYGVEVNRIICCGGIAEKNPFLMQIYADVTGRQMQVSASQQTCALGAAISAAVAARELAGGFADFKSAQNTMTRVRDVCYVPNPNNHQIYNEIFKLYQQIHNAFGGVSTNDLGHVMKSLLAIKDQQKTIRHEP